MTDRHKPTKKPSHKTEKQPLKAAKKQQAKDKTVAAEAVEVVRREQAAPSAPPSSVRPASRHVAEAADAVRRAQSAKPPATPAAKPAAPRPAAKAPAPAAKAPAPAALKAEPKPAPAKPKPQPERTAPSAEAKKPKPAASAKAPQSPIAEAFAAAAAANPVAKAAASFAPAANPFTGAAETLQQSFKAAGRGSVAVNRKLFDIAQANMQSGFDLARSLASARTPLEAAQLQFAFVSERMQAFASQAAELRALSAECLTEASEPFRSRLGGRKSDRKA
jgi:hypothetical protein